MINLTSTSLVETMKEFDVFLHSQGSNFKHLMGKIKIAKAVTLNFTFSPKEEKTEELKKAL